MRINATKIKKNLQFVRLCYRAKYIAATARIINRERGEGWLNNLRSLPYAECVSELIHLQGVGRKVCTLHTHLYLYDGTRG